MSRILPPLRRDVELIPIKHQGQDMLLVRDRLGLVPEGMALRPESFSLLSLLQEPREAAELAEEMARLAGGREIKEQEIESVVDQLDAAWLLDSDKLREQRDQIEAAYADLDAREPALAGSAYPEEPDEASSLLHRIMALASPVNRRAGRLAGLVAPHIDLAAGERVYAQAYRRLDPAPPDRVIILGVGHHLAEALFSITCKDFKTPLGIVRNDRDASRALQEAAGSLGAGNDFEHKFEHSIEFQTLFLRHLYGESTPPATPVLCGSAALLPEYGRQAFLDTAGPFLEVLSAMVADPDRRTLVLAGVDLCHIGPKFGHQHPAQELAASASKHDATLLERLAALDADGFWKETARVQDAYNVCGLTALACLLEVMPKESQGEILGYEMWREAPTQSAVSFAAAAFSV
ncbi:MAG: hypothetical protein PWQ57_218 [Desulfovibrionales bacterium]|nr:hypothetical protein [Desulfovibrionales bacterium]